MRTRPVPKPESQPLPQAGGGPLRAPRPGCVSVVRRATPVSGRATRFGFLASRLLCSASLGRSRTVAETERREHLPGSSPGNISEAPATAGTSIRHAGCPHDANEYVDVVVRFKRRKGGRRNNFE